MLPQVLELCDYVLGAARAPLALVEDRDVAERARPRAAARGLHRREALHRQHRRNVERHGFDEVEWKALAIRKRPLIEVPLEHPVGVVRDLVVLHPGDARHRRRVVDALDEIEDELLAVTAADEIDFAALSLH